MVVLLVILFTELKVEPTPCSEINDIYSILWRFHALLSFGPSVGHTFHSELRTTPLSVGKGRRSCSSVDRVVDSGE